MEAGSRFSLIRRCDEIGRRSGLKIRRWRQRTGSSPVTGTSSSQATYRLRRVSSFCAGLRFGFGCEPESHGIYTVAMFHVGVKSRFAPAFFILTAKLTARWRYGYFI